MRKLIRQERLRELVLVAQQENDSASIMLHIAAYSLLLCVPLECLPMVVRSDLDGVLAGDCHLCVAIVEGELAPWLVRRKDKVLATKAGFL